MCLRVKSITTEAYQILTLKFSKDVKTGLEMLARMLK